MKNTWKVVAAAILIGGGVWAGSLLNTTAEGAGVTNQPGTADDPVVTKSYVDQQIRQALNGGAPSTPVKDDAGSSEAKPSTNQSSSSNAQKLEIVTVKAGQKLMAAGGTEFIVRIGQAVVYTADANGISDLTDGVDVAPGASVANNHLLLFPRDGRGLAVKEGATGGLTVMVRGSYELK
ncbi:hypothetical protein ABE099_14835 [Paenibacillus turicensis]|uniref:hypothetical protein n=1 Tax=Paenibacillus turicensis TaxID=160487 RepID=UPI003D2888D0